MERWTDQQTDRFTRGAVIREGALIAVYGVSIQTSVTRPRQSKIIVLLGGGGENIHVNHYGRDSRV